MFACHTLHSWNGGCCCWYWGAGCHNGWGLSISNKNSHVQRHLNIRCWECKYTSIDAESANTPQYHQQYQHLYVCMYACIYARMHAHVCMYVCMHICIHTCWYITNSISKRCWMPQWMWVLVLLECGLFLLILRCICTLDPKPKPWNMYSKF